MNPDDDEIQPNTDGQDQVVYWLNQIDAFKKKHDDWSKKSWKIIEKYRDEKKRSTSEFNILWSNTETLKSSLYSATPVPSVTRRYKDADPIGLQVSEVLKRNLSYSVDSYDFDDVMQSVTEDYCLPGRGVVRVKYIPTYDKVQSRIPAEPVGFAIDEMGQQQPQYAEGVEMSDDIGPFTLGEFEEKVVYEEALCEYVFWEDFAFDVTRKWKDCKWVAFKGSYTRKQAVKEFGDKAYKLAMDYTASNDSNKKIEPDKENKAIVWEIWDKEKRKQYFVAPSYPDGVLKVEDDPLNLEGFFPCPKPIVAVSTNDTPVPVPLYTLYQDQAEELNRVSSRISALIARLKVTGAYNAVNDELVRISEAEDGHFIPIEGLGPDVRIDDMVSYWPIEKIAEVLAGLYRQREEIKQVIYDITGLSDILRGQTDPNETAAAQQLKSKFGGIRQSPRQKVIQKFARDLFRLKAEIMAEKFSPQTLSMVANMEVTPEMVDLMRNNHPRNFRIDIETDSTIEPNAMEEQQNRVAMVQSITEMFSAWAPLVQGGAPLSMVKELALFAIRGFKNSIKVEEAIEQMPDEMPQQAQGPSPEEIKGQIEQGKVQANLQIKQQEMIADRDKIAMQIGADKVIQQNKHNLEMQYKSAELDLEERNFEKELASKERMALATAIIKARTDAMMAQSASKEVEEEQEEEVQETGLDQEQIMQMVNAVQQALQAISAPKRVTITRDKSGNLTGGEVSSMGV
jgi:hypothetical protein